MADVTVHLTEGDVKTTVFPTIDLSVRGRGRAYAEAIPTKRGLIVSVGDDADMAIWFDIRLTVEQLRLLLAKCEALNV